MGGPGTPVTKVVRVGFPRRRCEESGNPLTEGETPMTPTSSKVPSVAGRCVMACLAAVAGLAWLALTAPVYAQSQGSVAGVVLDRQTRAPLPTVQVYLPDLDLGTLSQ